MLQWRVAGYLSFQRLAALHMIPGSLWSSCMGLNGLQLSTTTEAVQTCANFLNPPQKKLTSYILLSLCGRNLNRNARWTWWTCWWGEYQLGSLEPLEPLAFGMQQVINFKSCGKQHLLPIRSRILGGPHTATGTTPQKHRVCAAENWERKRTASWRIIQG